MALPHRHHHCCHLPGHVHYNGVLVQALAVTVERSAQHFQSQEMHVALNVISLVRGCLTILKVSGSSSMMYCIACKK